MLGSTIIFLGLITNCAVYAEVFALKNLEEDDKTYATSTWLYLIQNQDSSDDYAKISVPTGSSLASLIENEPTTFDGEINAYKLAESKTISSCKDQTFCATLTGYIYSTVSQTTIKQYVIAPLVTSTRYTPNSNSYFAFFPFSNATSQLYVRFDDFKYSLNSTIQFYLDEEFKNLAFDVTENSSNTTSPNPTLVFPLKQVFLKTTGPGIQFNATLVSDISTNITQSSGSFIMTDMYPNQISESQNFTIPIFSGNFLDIELTLQRNESANNTIRLITRHTDLSLDQNTKLRIQLDPSEDQFYVETQRPMYMKYTVVTNSESSTVTTIVTTSESSTGMSTTIETTTKSCQRFISTIYMVVVLMLV